MVYTVHRYLFNSINKNFVTTSDNEIKMHVQRNSITQNHMHDFYEIELVFSGSAEEIVNGNRINASEGDIFLISPETYHTVENKKDVVLISIAINTNFSNIELLSSIIAENADATFHRKLSKTDLDFVVSLFDHAVESIKSGNPFDSQIAKSCVNLIISMILGDEETGFKLNSKTMAVKIAMAYIRENYGSNPTLSEIAEHVNMSKNYFSVLFKENAGLSFKQFLNDVKLNNAAKKLKYSDTPILDICHDCGYDSLSTFYRKFKEKFSVSPQVYRSENQIDGK